MIQTLGHRTVLEQTRAHIDAEIISHFDAIQALRARRNSLAPTSLLPPELLTAIFVECVKAHGSQPNDFHKWIQVAHVCRHWRDIALACPALWNHLVFNDPKVTQTMITRSKYEPLVIKSDFVTPRNYDGLQVALKYTARTRELHLVATENLLRTLLNDIKDPAPLLESLSLMIPPAHTFFTLEEYKIPETLFAGQTPKLNKLVLYKCELMWDSPILRDLIHLDISGTVASGSPSLADMLTALTRMPTLESLSLADILPSVPSFPIPHHQSVTLSRLRHILLKGEVARCAQLLAHLTYPHDAILKLACTTNVIHGPEFSPILSFISAFEPSTSLRELRIQTTSATKLIIQLCNTASEVSNSSTTLSEETAPHFDESDVQLELNLSWAYYMAIDQTQRLALDICGLLPIRSIHTMYLDLFKEVPDWFWTDMWSQTPQLISLRLLRVRTGNLFRLLGQGRDQQSPESDRRDATVPLPGLKELKLERVSFQYGKSLDVSQLLACLQSRSDRGLPLQQLTIHRCINIYDKQVELLRDAVEDVIWDGHEEDEPDSDFSESDQDESEWSGSDGMGGSDDMEDSGSD
ncbi:hypothetical protein BJ138DRAFT_1143044 [Hygrophoropsis aurantiaca]|uniref:Uncharacterized protein n=1 Tax=Hygrophoropsis aurantiaca TaxID=72124 RepID=A0ACB8AMQ5_9AGAM|nr:hypothetical protein BJ138DRAFT_1143044 [Hygrophoropsis aurantiaca]